MHKLLYRLTARLPCRIIDKNDGPYLERYYVGHLFGVTFYLHRFVSPESEKHMHNHPWSWGRALVLAGSYTEESVVDICPQAGRAGAILRRRAVRWWNKVNGSHFHRISSAQPNTWTLFMHGPRLDIFGDPVPRRNVRGAVRLKGWGFIESIDSEITIFRPYPSTGATQWWLVAPKGRTVGRVPE